MGYVLGVLALLAAFAVYGWLCVIVLVHVGIPGTLIGLALGAASGLALALAVAVLRLLRPPAEVVIRPDDVVERRFRLVRPPPAIEPDRAWPAYFAGQVAPDLWSIATLLGLWVLAVFRGAFSAVRPARWVALAFWPVLLPVVALLAGLGVGALAGLLMVAAVVLVVALAAWAVGLTVLGALRGFDRVAAGLRRAEGSCPRCYEVSRRPAYRCKGCQALHRDLRPGPLGVVWRRCGCGVRLPTTVTRAGRSALLAAACPLCRTPMHPGAGAATDVRVPVFGAPAAGKTHLVTAAVVGLLRGPGDVTVADRHSKRIYAEYAAIVDAGGSAAKTDAARQPIAVTLRLRQGKRDALVHVYDAAGEALNDPGRNPGFHYLDEARTLVYVLDPFALPAVHDRYAARFAPLFAAANVSPEPPEPSYQATVVRLRQYGVAVDRKRLAFVVSKSDLLRQLPERVTDPREWLLAQGADNLVAAAERDFGEVRYFLVSALSGQSAEAPFRWLLSGEPVRVP